MKATVAGGILIVGGVIAATVAAPVEAAPIVLYPSEMLVLDSNASAGNGLLFAVDRSTGAATVLGSGFGLEPWSLALLSPTTLVAGDMTAQTVYSLNFATGQWTSIIASSQLEYPSGAMVADGPDSVLVASGGGKIYKVNVLNGQQSLFADYSGLKAYSPWGMARLDDGSLIVTDIGNGDVICVKPDGTSRMVMTGAANTGTWGVGILDANHVAVDVTESTGRSGIAKVDLTTGDETFLTSPTAFRIVNDITPESNGDLLVSDQQGATRGGVYEVDPGTGSVTLISNDSKFANPTDILVVPEPASLGLLVIGSVELLARRRRRS